jgi:hypothetical protein
MRPRDQYGWRVPTPGTTAATVYTMKQQGHSIGDIARTLGCSRDNVRVHLFKLRWPERTNQWISRWNSTAPPRARKPVTAEEAHARKLARVLCLPLAQARILVASEAA